MSLPIYQRVAVTDSGDVIPGAEYTVINENTGVAAPIYSDRTGATLLSAPYFADSVGTIQFFIAQGTTFRVAASGGVGTYTDRYVYGVAEAVLVQANGNAAINILSDGLPATTGTLQTYGALRLSSDTTAAAVDFGLNGANPWMQSCDKSNLGQSYNLLLNPNGGNVGIGTSSPAKKVEIAGNNQALASNTTLRFTDTDTATQTNQHFGKIEFNSLDASAVSPNRAYITAASENSLAGSYISFGTSAFTAAVSEKLRIDGSGNLLVGKTSTGDFTPGFEVQQTGTMLAYRTNGLAGIFGRSNNGELIRFNENVTQVGSISITGNSTAYNTSSDYRLKEDDLPMTGATERVKALRPINFAWKVNGSRVDGFFAHELAEVVPEAATGAKDAMRDEEYEVTPAVFDAEGIETESAVMGTRSVPDYQGIDQSKLVPLLTATIQELIARIEALEAGA